MDNCSLSKTEEIELQRYVNSKGIIFISTPFSRAATERLIQMDVPGFKIGSGECNNYPLIKHIAKVGKPVILSTGMNTIESVSKAVDIFHKYRIPHALLHCTNVYPTPPELVRLGAMIELRENFPDVVIGLSDHTTTNYPAFGAVALGASIIERHFTDSMDRKGPDIVCSMDSTAFRELNKGCKIIKQTRGGSKGSVDEEKPTIDFAYASVVTIKDIKAGEKFTMDNIWVKRPGTGEIMAVDFDSILGKKATNFIPNDAQLKWKDIQQ